MPSLVHISLAGFTSTWDDCHMEGLSKLLQTGILSLDLRGVLFTSPQAQDLYDQIHKSCLLQVKFDTEEQPFHVFAIQKEEGLYNFLPAVEETLLDNAKNTDCLQMVTKAFENHAEDTFWAIIESQFGTTACALTKIRSNRTTGYQQQLAETRERLESSQLNTRVKRILEPCDVSTFNKRKKKIRTKYVEQINASGFREVTVILCSVVDRV